MRIPDPDDAMWCVVMFDLPVKTMEQRRQATAFRNLLLDLGYLRAQLSVYVMYTPVSGGSLSAVAALRKHLPPGGEVRIIQVTDRQWSKGVRFSNGHLDEQESEPLQLTIF